MVFFAVVVPISEPGQGCDISALMSSALRFS